MAEWLISKRNPSVFGGTMIIAGTAIGAGMLALPIISAGMWLWYSIALMVVTWFLMLLSAQALLEVNLSYPPGASFHTLVKDNLGQFLESCQWFKRSICVIYFNLCLCEWWWFSANAYCIGCI